MGFILLPFIYIQYFISILLISNFIFFVILLLLHIEFYDFSGKKRTKKKINEIFLFIIAMA